jgi:hypothetical protein
MLAICLLQNVVKSFYAQSCRGGEALAEQPMMPAKLNERGLRVVQLDLDPFMFPDLARSLDLSPFHPHSLDQVQVVPCLAAGEIKLNLAGVRQSNKVEEGASRLIG